MLKYDLAFNALTDHYAHTEFIPDAAWGGVFPLQALTVAVLIL